MLVRVKFGRYEGEVRDIAPDVATGLIAAGRAESMNPSVAGDHPAVIAGIAPREVAPEKQIAAANALAKAGCISEDERQQAVASAGETRLLSPAEIVTIPAKKKRR
jgi:hypothetical protein